MKLYDHDEYREDFMSFVYGLLASDGTNDRANQIIDAFDACPAFEITIFPGNEPLTLYELREMDGEPVWVISIGNQNNPCWMLVDAEYELCREAHGGMAVFENYGKTWLAYRRKPEEGTI